MKPDDLCIVDLDGKQVSGKRKRSSEILLHLTIMKARPDVRSCVHCHPPHATAFAVAHEPIPKCMLPEFEVFLGEVAIAPYETPGGQAFADTVLPYVKDTDTILLANHGTITYGTRPRGRLLQDRDHRRLLPDPDPGQAARPGELLRRRQGRRADQAQARASASPTPGSTRGLENCDLCGNSLFREGYSDFKPEPKAFIHRQALRTASPAAPARPARCPSQPPTAAARPTADASSRRSPTRSWTSTASVRTITDQVMSGLNGARGSRGSRV